MQLTEAVDASNPCRRSLARPQHGVKAFLDWLQLFSSCGLDEVNHAENCSDGTPIRVGISEYQKLTKHGIFKSKMLRRTYHSW